MLLYSNYFVVILDLNRISDVEEDIVTEELNTIEDNPVTLEVENPNQARLINDEKSSDAFLQKLRFWALSENVKHTQLRKLLKIMEEEGKIDKQTDVRTLLCTPKATKNNCIKNLDKGQYLHFPLKESIKNILQSLGKQELLEASHCLDMSFNIDGTPISLSGGYSFWVILGCVNNLSQRVFPIGIYKGRGKPINCNEFLKTFVNETCDLITNGIEFQSKCYKFAIHSFLCDAPAMAFIKHVKCHGGYHCCQKCFIKGQSLVLGNGRRKVIYSELNSPLRTDHTFRNRIDYSGHVDDGHHKESKSILEKFPVDMIKHFPLDKMHLVDEGVTKKLIQIWLGKPNAQKLSIHKVQILNTHLKSLYKYSCSEFQRKIRTLSFFPYMKASEFRVFLLYVGPVVLKQILKPSLYKHFLCFSLAIRILTSPVYYNIYNSYAAELLNYFVKHFSSLYGLKNMTYNVHGLTHLAADINNVGPADENSCYKFEAYIKKIKSFLHSSNRPLEQCYNRIKERSIVQYKHPKDSKRIQANCLEQNITGTNFYKKCVFPNFVIKCNSFGDNYLMLKNKQIIRVKYFERTSNEIIIYGQHFYNKKPINREPFQLEDFHIFFGKFNENILKYKLDKLEEVTCKICCLLYKEDLFFVSPLIHTLTTLE